MPSVTTCDDHRTPRATEHRSEEASIARPAGEPVTRRELKLAEHARHVGLDGSSSEVGPCAHWWGSESVSGRLRPMTRRESPISHPAYGSPPPEPLRIGRPLLLSGHTAWSGRGRGSGHPGVPETGLARAWS